MGVHVEPSKLGPPPATVESRVTLKQLPKLVQLSNHLVDCLAVPELLVFPAQPHCTNVTHRVVGSRTGLSLLRCEALAVETDRRFIALYNEINLKPY